MNIFDEHYEALEALGKCNDPDEFPQAYARAVAAEQALKAARGPMAFRGGFLAAVNLAKSWLEDMPADGLIEHLEAELSEYDKWKR